MKKLLILPLLLLGQSAWPEPNFILKMDKNDEVVGVDAVLYLGQDNDPNCSGDMFVDEIKSFNYVPVDGNIEIFTQNTHSPDGLFLHKQDLNKFNFNENNYLSMFLKTKQKIVFLGERCGSGGYFNIGSMIKLNEINNLK